MVKKNGFTLIEMLVVTAVFMLLGGLLINSLFSILKSNTKAELMKEIRQSGSYALDVMSKMITNGEVVSVCPSLGSSIKIKNPDGEETTFFCDDSDSTLVHIASGSAHLTSTQSIKVKDCNGVFQCEVIGENARKVTINFVLKQQGSSPRAEDQAQQTFQRVIMVRNE